MKYKLLFSLLIVLLFSSCAQDRKLEKYTRLVEASDKIILYKRIADTFAVTEQIFAREDLRSFKQILTRNIKPELQQSFYASHKIVLLKNEKPLGVLLISANTEQPFVNFTNEQFRFGFPLTYGIGMRL